MQKLQNHLKRNLLPMKLLLVLILKLRHIQAMVKIWLLCIYGNFPLRTMLSMVGLGKNILILLINYKKLVTLVVNKI